MKIKELFSKDISKKIICIVLLLCIALVSIFVVSKPATSPETYKQTIQSIDEKKGTVMGVSTVAATASTALALIPTDATTPVAEQIMEIASYLFIVVCVLVLEKSLLTVMGYISFNILIPVACALMGIYVFLKKKTLKILAIKIIVFEIVIVMIIPVSLKIGDLILDINNIDPDRVVQDLSESIDLENIESDDSSVEKEDEEKKWLDKVVDKVKDGASVVAKKAKEILNKFIDIIALFIIAYCAIPVIVVLLVVWLVKFLFGIALPIPDGEKIKLFKKRKNEEKTADLMSM